MVKRTHHAPDYLKNKTADVIRHDSLPANPQKHWQMNYDLTPHGDNTGWGAFLPRTGKSRPQPHTKLNECDH